jgi:hypothetical protein
MDEEAQVAAAMAITAKDEQIVQAEHELAAERKLGYSSEKVFIID